MISKSSKFPSRTQLLPISRARQTILDASLTNYGSPHTPSRLSVVVPVKVNKRAVARNSFKELVYDQVWKMIKDKNLDCIVMFKPMALIKGKISEDLIKNELSQSPGLF